MFIFSIIQACRLSNISQEDKISRLLLLVSISFQCDSFFLSRYISHKHPTFMSVFEQNLKTWSKLISGQFCKMQFDRHITHKTVLCDVGCIKCMFCIVYLTNYNSRINAVDWGTNLDDILKSSRRNLPWLFRSKRTIVMIHCHFFRIFIWTKLFH